MLSNVLIPIQTSLNVSIHYRSERNSPLHEAVSADNIVNVKKLIDKGVDIDAKNFYGKTPLVLACQMGFLSIVKMLIETKAEINATDDFHKNCLHFAAHNGMRTNLYVNTLIQHLH